MRAESSLGESAGARSRASPAFVPPPPGLAKLQLRFAPGRREGSAGGLPGAGACVRGAWKPEGAPARCCRLAIAIATRPLSLLVGLVGPSWTRPLERRILGGRALDSAEGSRRMAQPASPTISLRNRGRVLEDRIAIRLPWLYLRFASLVWRLPVGSRPRRVVVERAVERSYSALGRGDLAALHAMYHPECCFDFSRLRTGQTARCTRDTKGSIDWCKISKRFGGLPLRTDRDALGRSARAEHVSHACPWGAHQDRPRNDLQPSVESTRRVGPACR